MSRLATRSVTLTVCVVCAVVAAIALFQTAVRTQGSGPVGAYGFSEGSGTTTADLSGNGNTGTLMNGAVRTTSGRFGRALTFDGVDDGVRMPTSSATLLQAGPFTMEAWVQPSVAHTEVRQIIQAQGGNGDGLRLTANGRPQFRADFPAGPIDVTGPAAVPVGTWTHVAVVYDGLALRLFVNGGPVASITASGAMVGTGRTWFARTRGGGNPFAGQLDEVRIYPRALTVAEVAFDLTAPVDPATPFQVSAVTPVAGAFGVTTTPVTATLSAAAEPTSVHAGTVVLAAGAGAPVSATVTYDAPTRRITLTPSAPLDPLATYTARVVGGSGGVRDTLNRTLAADVAWTFQKAADDDLPSVTYAFSEGTGLATADGSATATVARW
jgi:hypothetical protein